MKDEGSRLSDYVDRLGDHLLDFNRPGRCSELFIANCMELWCLNKCISVPLSCGINFKMSVYKLGFFNYY